MPFLVAKLGPLQGDRRRVVEARRRESVEEVSGDAASAPTGSLVLLHGTKPPWSALSRLHPARWPDGVGTPEQLWEAQRGYEKHELHGMISSQGSYALDSRGVPCEIGMGRQSAPVRVVLNYTGWRISDFPRDPVRVLVCDSEIGEVWIVPPDSVPQPSVGSAPAREGWAPARQPAPAPPPASPPQRAAVLPPRPVPSSPPLQPPPPRPFQTTLQWSALEFGDGHVSFVVYGQQVTIDADVARALYQDVRADLDGELPNGVTVRGTLHADGRAHATIEGLDALGQIFERVQYKRFVRAAVESPTWLDAEDLASRRPGGGGSRDPEDLIGILEFGLGKRAEAFRRLFKKRDRSERLQTLPGRAVIVSFPAADGGHRWYAWEVVLDDHATYLFRPSSKESRDAMLAWTQAAAGSKRKKLLDDRGLQAQLGYVRRVMHHDQGDDALGGWWQRLCNAVGLSD